VLPSKKLLYISHYLQCLVVGVEKELETMVTCFEGRTKFLNVKDKTFFRGGTPLKKIFFRKEST
jgi:hypothetical protein